MRVKNDTNPGGSILRDFFLVNLFLNHFGIFATASHENSLVPMRPLRQKSTTTISRMEKITIRKPVRNRGTSQPRLLFPKKDMKAVITLNTGTAKNISVSAHRRIHLLTAKDFIINAVLMILSKAFRLLMTVSAEMKKNISCLR